MMRRLSNRNLGAFPLVSCGFALFLLVMWARVAANAMPDDAGAPAKAAPSPPPPFAQAAQAPPAASPDPQAGYVGDDDTCLTCHDGKQKGYADTPHGMKIHPGSPAAKQGCETCHGPGAKHVESGGGKGLMKAFGKMPPREANGTCLTCHSRDAHTLWEGSAHESRNLACVTCHSIHDFKSPSAQLKQRTEPELCASCHRDKAAKIDRSGHMPVREGKMRCSTCHNPHGATNVKLLRKGDSLAEACTACHADKRGPFLWEHAPTRDGCTTCHDPHGSSNERMLVSKPPILCQRCHVATRHPSTIYDGALVGAGATPNAHVYARSCVMCHSNIHGSNHPSGQRFIR